MENYSFRRGLCISLVGFSLGILSSYLVTSVRNEKARNKERFERDMERHREMQAEAYKESKLQVGANIQNYFYNGENLFLGCETDDGNKFIMKILDIPPNSLENLAWLLSIDEKRRRVLFTKGNLSEKVIKQPTFIRDLPTNEGETPYISRTNFVSRYAKNVTIQ